MIIDFHTHPEYRNPMEKYSPQEFVAAMDMGGIDKSCVYGCDQADPGTSPVWGDKRQISLSSNVDDETLAEYCSAFPDRLIGVTSIHPNRYQPERKVEKAIKEYKMKAVKIYPHSGFYPNDSNLIRTYEFCSKENIPLIIHTGPKATRWQWMKYNQPIFVDDVATNFPDLKIVICHGGYPWTEEFMAVAYTNPNILVDLTFMEVIEDTFQIPDLIEKTVRRLAKMIGPKRMLWGSEGPYMDLPLYGKHDPSSYKESQYRLVNRFDFLSKEEKADILGNNAAALLGLYQ